MGFPAWTLWGMGLSVAGALIAISLAWLGQSPHLLRRIGLSGARLDQRVRAFTGYALALLLLAVAFFLAGVPLGSASEGQLMADQQATTSTPPVGTSDLSADSVGDAGSPTPEDIDPTPATPETGAFSGPPATTEASESRQASASELATVDETQVVTATLEVAASPTAVETTPRATATSTPAPTDTPLPTLTPTAILGQTAVVSSNGSTLWLKRSPGGQNLVLVRDGEVLIIRPGRANEGGLLWREVATVTGIGGWLQQEFILLSEPQSES